MNLDHIQRFLHELSEETRILIGSIETIPLPESSIDFHREYIAQSKPVIISNLSKEWDANKKWNYEYFNKLIGPNIVQISVTPDGLADAAPKDSCTNDTFRLPEEREMRFCDFIDKLDANVSTNKNEILYLQKQNNCLTLDYPELAKDVPNDIRFFTEALGSRPDAVNIWMGSSQSVSSLHRDPYENIYTVIRGKKIFKLYAPTDRGFIKYTECKVRRHSRKGGKWKLIEEPNLATIKWIVGGADQIAKSLAPIIVELVAGETLYLPVGWFHEVSQADNTIAVNYWYDRSYDQSYTKEKFLNEIVDDFHSSSPI